MQCRRLGVYTARNCWRFRNGRSSRFRIELDRRQVNVRIKAISGVHLLFDGELSLRLLHLVKGHFLSDRDVGRRTLTLPLAPRGLQSPMAELAELPSNVGSFALVGDTAPVDHLSPGL